jgi:Autographiviridae endonuclease VII
MRQGWTQRSEANLLRMYGIDLAEYGRMYVEQGGVCAICRDRGERTTAGRDTLHVDHDHETGKVRGLLCGVCNRGLGLLGDSPLYLRSALAYLEKHTPAARPSRDWYGEYVERIEQERLASSG